MIILRRTFFSQNNILNTNNGPGFIRGRKYDTDFDRLGRMNTSQRELNGKLRDLASEQRKMTSELNRGIRPGELRE